MDKDVRDLVFNLMCDLKKKDIDNFTKAKLISEYLEDNNLSQRQLAKQIGVSHSVMQDWVRWNNISKEEYDVLISEGYTGKEIYKSLRSGTLAGKKAIDVALENCISKLQIFKIRPPYSEETKKLLYKLNHIIEVIDKQVK